MTRQPPRVVMVIAAALETAARPNAVSQTAWRRPKLPRRSYTVTVDRRIAPPTAAPGRVVEIHTWTPANSYGTTRPHPPDSPGQSDVGSGADCQRTLAEAGSAGAPSHRAEVHTAARGSRSAYTHAVATLATFLHHYAQATVACDFCASTCMTVPTAILRLSTLDRLHPSRWIVAVTRGTWPTTRVVCP
jgi:hypothetical protein